MYHEIYILGILLTLAARAADEELAVTLGDGLCKRRGLRPCEREESSSSVT